MYVFGHRSSDLVVDSPVDVTAELPKFTLPKEGCPAEAAYQLIASRAFAFPARPL